MNKINSKIPYQLQKCRYWSWIMHPVSEKNSQSCFFSTTLSNV